VNIAALLQDSELLRFSKPVASLKKDLNFVKYVALLPEAGFFLEVFS
jgi:hypothetical protein